MFKGVKENIIFSKEISEKDLSILCKSQEK